MSGIIASYFIEPVVRQARRFSNLPAPSTSNDDIGQSQTQGTGPSHATCSTANHDMSESHCQRARPSTSTLTPLSSASAQRNPPASFLGQALFDRFVPLLTTSRNMPQSPDSHQTTRQAAHQPLGATAPTSPLGISGSCAQPCSEPIITPIRPEQNNPIPTSSSVEADSSATAMPQSPYSRSLPVRLPDRNRAIQAIRRTSAREAGFPHGARFRTLDATAADTKPPGSLPEDDGQQHLRQRILDIWEMNVSSEEKAQRMHSIMNESHRAAQRPKSAESTTSGRPLSSSSSTSHIFSLDTYTKSPPTISLDPANPYNITPDDLIPSFRPQSASEIPETLDLTSRSDPLDGDSTSTSPEPEFEAGCIHYRRNVKVQCFACKTWWPCRICHDEANLGHELPRHLTENMLCMTCKNPGPAGQYCKHCSSSAAHYYCEVCKLWDDSNRSIYHCAGCGICRLGEGIGKDYEHCKKCKVCIAIQHHKTHRCIERATECDCPICGEYMFNSSEAVVSLPCGHYLHRTCYDEYITTAYQCPVCKKSAINMELHWRKLDDEIASQPMPSRWRGTIVEVRCNDCGGKSRCSYHWLGCRCGLCDSFNTVEVQVIGREGENGLTTTASQNPARINRRSATVPQALARSYFQDEDTEHGEPGAGISAALADGTFGLSNTAYEMLARMSRSLSPLRHYFDSDGEDNERRAGAVTESELEDLGFWSDEDGEETDEDDEEYEDDEDEDELEDDDEDSDDDGELDLRLIGHR